MPEQKSIADQINEQLLELKTWKTKIYLGTRGSATLELCEADAGKNCGAWSARLVAVEWDEGGWPTGVYQVTKL